MTAKQYLRQVKRLDNLINAKLEQVDELRGIVTKITSKLDAVKVEKHNFVDKTGTLISKIVDLEKEINKDIDKLIDLKAEVIENIDKVKNQDYRLLLTLRYLNYWTWEQIAVEMNYSYVHVHRLHSRALREFNINS